MTLIFNEINPLRLKLQEWRTKGETIGFVPTMGALHIGHESLIKKARESCDRVVVSIFVNPAQFGAGEDYEKYPRTLESDSEICKKYGVEAIFAPCTTEMYPDFDFTKVCPPNSYVDKLCGKSRIGHFDGVATVVMKLFNIIQPDKAFFGLKDAQQLVIIKKMCLDLNFPVEIIPCPIIRDFDGLACSSRNAYLSPELRTKALSLNKILKKVEALYHDGVKSKRQVFEKALEFLDRDANLEYLEAIDFENLQPSEELKYNVLVAIAAKIGNVRLIDNVILN
jgi:pantoate--beta-alanine ligase